MIEQDHMRAGPIAVHICDNIIIDQHHIRAGSIVEHICDQYWRGLDWAWGAGLTLGSVAHPGGIIIPGLALY